MLTSMLTSAANPNSPEDQCDFSYSFSVTVKL